MENDNSTKVCQDQLLKASQDELLKASQDESFALDDLKEEFAYLEKNSEGKWIRHTIHLHKILEFSRLSEFINKPLDIIMDEFNKLKVRFVLDGTGYSSMEDYLKGNQNGTRSVLEQDQNKTRSDFFALFNSQLEKSGKSFKDFIIFLNHDKVIEERDAQNNPKNYSIQKELGTNEFYFIAKAPQSADQNASGIRNAILYKITSNITWDAFHSYASDSADIITLTNNIQNNLLQQSHGTILNHHLENSGAPQGLYNFKTYKFIDNINLREWTIDSVKPEDEMSKMILDNYNKTFSSFLSENLKTSGKDLYSFKNITNAQKLNKFNLIDLTQDDVQAFKNEDLSYEMKGRDVFEVLIQGDYSEILKIINSEDFKIKGKTLFKYLEENAKILFYKKNIGKQDFKIRKFFNNSESLTKYFVITSISDEKYRGVFQLFNMTDIYINNRDELFQNSLFNFYKKTNVDRINVEIWIQDNPQADPSGQKFQFEKGVSFDLKSFSSFEEAKNYFLDRNMFFTSGKKYLITTLKDFNNDTFYFYNIYNYYENETVLSSFILGSISQNNNYIAFESSLTQKNIGFEKQTVYTKDVIKQNYYLLGNDKINTVTEYVYKVLHFSNYPFFQKDAPQVGHIYTSVDSKQFSEIFSDSKEKYQEWNDIINRLKEDKFKNKYLGHYSLAGVPYSGLYGLINDQADSSSFSFYYKGLIENDNDFIKTILFYAKSEKKFYSIKVFTPLGVVEKDYFKKDQIFSGCNSINDIKINSNDFKFSYYIKDSSWIKELGSLESIKTNQEYQKLRTVFKGLGYENLYNEKYFDGTGVKNLKDLLISNLTEYISTDIEKPDLSQFYLNRVLASEEEFSQAVKDVVLGAYNFLTDSCNAKSFFFIGGVSILNKEVAEKYKGEYYDPYFSKDVNKIKRKLEYLYFGQQGWNFWGYESHNNIFTFDLYKTTMPESVFKETYLKDKNSSNKSNYYFESLGYQGLTSCFKLGMKYWFEPGAQSGNHIDIYKKENVYYFDKNAKTFYKIDKDYTFKAVYGGYESGLMQCPNINKVIEYPLASYGFIFFGIANNPTSIEKIKDIAIHFPNTICYSYQKKSTIINVYKEHFPLSFIELNLAKHSNTEKIYAFPTDSDLILSISQGELNEDSIQEKLRTALELKDSEFLDKFRFFSEDEMKEIKLGAKFLSFDEADFKRSSDEKFSLTKAELDEILERIS